MILYTLACDAGHRFESWFRDSVAYEAQVAQGLLACPTCHSSEVVKTIMAPAVVSSAGVLAPRQMDAALADETSRKTRSMLRVLRDKIVAEGHDVGPDFAIEARRMHEGGTRVRAIYGQASPAEARDLVEEGIMVLPMPTVPDELN